MTMTKKPPRKAPRKARNKIDFADLAESPRPVQRAPAPKAEPAGTPATDTSTREMISGRIPGDLVRRVREVAGIRAVCDIAPAELQDILAEAVSDWLDRHEKGAKAAAAKRFS